MDPRTPASPPPAPETAVLGAGDVPQRLPADGCPRPMIRVRVSQPVVSFPSFFNFF